MGHFYRTCVEVLVIWLEIVLKLVANVLVFEGEICCKQHQLKQKFFLLFELSSA